MKIGSEARALGWMMLLAGLAPIRAETLRTESRTPYLHNIPLHDAEGDVISPPAFLGEDGKPQEPTAPPYSTEQTCGKCHDYKLISQGWHFNEALGNVKAGPPGEPWILTDAATRTQIPVSYRAWKGTFKPSELGLSDYDFMTNFAHHFPGGGVGEPAKIDSTNIRNGRMQITGTLEIDCLICHQSTGTYNHEARNNAVQGENFRWAPSVAAGLGGLASFRSAGSLADRWRPGKPAPSSLPGIKYNRAKFDVDNNVLFQVTRRASSANCYYCHTSQTGKGDAGWHSDRDVHLRAGLVCVDCHRNGLDHMIVRGYEGEVTDRIVSEATIEARARIIQRDDDAISRDGALALAQRQLESEMGMIKTLTCAGCHAAGRLGSPKPVHKGLPLIHFEKMTCTACHSGPELGPQPEIVRTPLAHKLGLPAPTRGENTAPIILEPVFLYNGDGKVAPFRVVWPSYWGRRKEGKITPLLPAEAAKTADLPKQKPEDIVRDPFNTEPLTDEQIQKALKSLAGTPEQGEPVFVAAGKLYHMEAGKLFAEESEKAAAYSWPLGHDVRPARQALGAKGCSDCHSSDAPMFFASVLARGPVEPGNGVKKTMWELRRDDKTWIEAFALGFTSRLLLKCILFGAALIIFAVLVCYGLRGVSALTAAASSQKSQP